MELKIYSIANDGTKFYFTTNKDAPQYKVVSVDISKPLKKRTFMEVLPEDKDANLEDIVPVANDKFAVVYKRDVKDEVYIYSMDGQQLARVAPDFVGAASISGRRSHSSFFATLSGFTDPGIVARYDFTQPDEKKWTIYRTTILKGMKTQDFDVRQVVYVSYSMHGFLLLIVILLKVWYTSKDGTRVPMFIVRHKDTKFDGTAPAIQYGTLIKALQQLSLRNSQLTGYGGFAVSIDPFFSASLLTFLQRYGAILAVPNIRGGGEFGDEWHLAGTRERKVRYRKS